MKSEVVREKSPSSGDLLQLDLGAGRLELLLDFLGFGLGSVLLDGLRRAFDEILRFLEAKPVMARTSLMTPILFAPASLRTMVNSVCASAAGAGSGGATRGSGGDGSGGGNAPLAFEVFNQRGEIDEPTGRRATR